MFSDTVAELYVRAADIGPREFLEEAIQFVHRLISFDGAIIGIGNADTTLVKHFVIDKTSADRPLPSLRDESATAIDSVIPLVFSEHPGKPIAGDWKDVHNKLTGSRWHDLARQYGVQKLLSYIDPATGHGNVRWVVLYRLGESDFQDADVEHLQAIWRHLQQAIKFNLIRALHCSDIHRVTRAIALINSSGYVEIANKVMIDMLKREWPDFNEISFPIDVVALLVKKGIYHGKRIELTASTKFGFMACVAKHISPTKALTQSEMNVAHRFAHGMTHKEIAAHLNVSPNTVRNQLAHVYSKLGVHGKAELARLMYNA